MKTKRPLKLTQSRHRNLRGHGRVNNLLDTEAPLIIIGLQADGTGTEADATTYYPIGRRFYAGVKLKF